MLCGSHPPHPHTPPPLQKPAVSLLFCLRTLPNARELSRWSGINKPPPLSRGNLQPVGSISWWKNIPASHPLDGQLWGASNRVLHRFSSKIEPQLPSIVTSSIMHPFLDFFTSLSQSSYSLSPASRITSQTDYLHPGLCLRL